MVVDDRTVMPRVRMGVPSRAIVREVTRAIGRVCLPALIGVTLSSGLPAHAANAGWWVSLGVYASEPAADQARARFATDAGSLQVVPFERDGRTLYRVASGPFADARALRTGLRDARSRVRGAFAVPATDAPLSSPADSHVLMAVAEPRPAATAEAVEAAPAADAPVPARAPATASEGAPASTAPPRAAAPGPAATPPGSAPLTEDDDLAGLRLDSATERLLRDDAALQRELARLSRGLPKGLGNEIQAAQEQGVSLREVHARTMVGPQSPSTPPPGYQLHRLHRDDAPPAADEDVDDE